MGWGCLNVILYIKIDWFLKFGDEKSHLESIQNGTLRFGSGAYYKKIEEEQGKKGVGDKHDGAMVVSKADIGFYDEITDELIAEIPVRETTLNINHISQLGVFCLYALTGDDLEVIGENEKFYFVRTVFGEEDKNLLQENFGEHVLIINTDIFLDRLVKKMNGVWDAHGLVKYDDYSKNNKKRWDSYKKDEVNILFWKDARYFKHQKEYRVVLNTPITEPTCYDIGDIHDITSYGTSEQLFTDGFNIAIEK